MTTKVTVVAEVDEGATELAAWVESLDGQTMPYTDFEVVFIVRPGETRRRLEELASRRPNVILLDHSEEAGLSVATQVASGAYLLQLGLDRHVSGSRLAPDALETLSGFAREQDCDVVIGREMIGRRRWISEVGAVDAGRLDEHEVLDALLTAPMIMVRRELAADCGLVTDRPAAERLLAITRAVGRLARYPCITAVGASTASSPADGQPHLTVETRSATWRDSAIVMELRGFLPAGGVRSVLLGLAHPAAHVEVWRPLDLPIDDHGEWGGVIEIDVLRAAGGHPLSEGVWEVLISASTAPTPDCSLATTVTTPVLLSRRLPALVNGVPIVVASGTSSSMVIDVGGTQHAMVTSIDAADVVVEESARGTLLAARLPEVAVHGCEGLAGFVLLDKFKLPAQVTTTPDGVTVHAFVSGLAGSSIVSTQFATSKAALTGLTLTVSPLGAFSIAPTPVDTTPTTTSAKKTSPATSAAAVPKRRPDQTKKSNPSVPVRKVAPSGVLAWVRHHVPAPLEPAARAVAGHPTAKKVYRRLTTR